MQKQYATAARHQVLRETWEQGVPTEEVLARINELPGPTCGFQQVANMASTLKLKRPAWFKSQVMREKFAERATQVAKANAPDISAITERAAATWQDVVDWAKYNKVNFDGCKNNREAFQRINETRLHTGNPPFRLIPPSKGRGRLPSPHIGNRLANELEKEGKAA